MAIGGFCASEAMICGKVVKVFRLSMWKWRGSPKCWRLEAVWEASKLTWTTQSSLEGRWAQFVVFFTRNATTKLFSKISLWTRLQLAEKNLWRCPLGPWTPLTPRAKTITTIDDHDDNDDDNEDDDNDEDDDDADDDDDHVDDDGSCAICWPSLVTRAEPVKSRPWVLLWSHKMLTLQAVSRPLNAGSGDKHESLQEINGAFEAISVLADVRFQDENNLGEIDSWLVLKLPWACCLFTVKRGNPLRDEAHLALGRLVFWLCCSCQDEFAEFETEESIASIRPTQRWADLSVHTLL